MLTMTIAPGRHYKNFYRLFLFGPTLSRSAFYNQSDAFLRYQTQQNFRSRPQHAS